MTIGTFSIPPIQFMADTKIIDKRKIHLLSIFYAANPAIKPKTPYTKHIIVMPNPAELFFTPILHKCRVMSPFLAYKDMRAKVPIIRVVIDL